MHHLGMISWSGRPKHADILYGLVKPNVPVTIRSHFRIITNFPGINSNLDGNVQHDTKGNQTKPWAHTNNLLLRLAGVGISLTTTVNNFTLKHPLMVVDVCLMLSEGIVTETLLGLPEQLQDGQPDMKRIRALTRSYNYGLSTESLCRMSIKFMLCTQSIPSIPWQQVHAIFADSLIPYSLIVLTNDYLRWTEPFPIKLTVSWNTIVILRLLSEKLRIAEMMIHDPSQPSSQIYVAPGGFDGYGAQFITPIERLGGTFCK